MAKILVRRSEKGWRDRFRAYKVFIDDQEAGRLRRGEAAEFEIGPGRHVVQARIDWKRSASFEVSGDGQELLRFRCGPARSPIYAFIDLFKRAEAPGSSLSRTVTHSVSSSGQLS